MRVDSILSLAALPLRIFLHLSLLVAVVASQLGEGMLRGPEDFDRYRGQLLGRG